MQYQTKQNWSDKWLPYNKENMNEEKPQEGKLYLVWLGKGFHHSSFEPPFRIAKFQQGTWEPYPSQLSNIDEYVIYWCELPPHPENKNGDSNQ